MMKNFIAIAFVAALHAQEPTTEWTITVKDTQTGQPISGATVTARKARVEARTDQSGQVVLDVDDGLEDLLTHGLATHTHHCGAYATDQDRTIWLTPYSAFHKTPLIQPSGSNGAITFTGVTESTSGPLPYTITVEVPPNVLPEAASFWIAPVPAYASAYPAGTDTLLNSCLGQFNIELRGANGKKLTAVLKQRGIVVRVSPTYLPTSALAPVTSPVKGFSYRLTPTATTWNQQTDECFWDPATQTVTAHVTACSWWILILPFLVSDFGSGSQPIPTPPSPPQPPAPPAIEITRADCVTSSLVVASPVVCGHVIRQMNAGLADGNTESYGASFRAAIEANFDLGAGEFLKLLTRMSAKAGLKLEATANGTTEVTHSGTISTTVAAQEVVGPNCACYSGELALFLYQRKYTLSAAGFPAFTWPVTEGAMTLACLEFDPNCGEGCQFGAGPAKKQVQNPRNVKLCPNDIMTCQ